jgi:hypothetical protein
MNTKRRIDLIVGIDQGEIIWVIDIGVVRIKVDV